MPRYDMKCPLCDERWEVQRAMSECDDPAPCPECGADGKLVFTNPPVVPWYPGTTREFFKERKRRP